MCLNDGVKMDGNCFEPMLLSWCCCLLMPASVFSDKIHLRIWEWALSIHSSSKYTKVWLISRSHFLCQFTWTYLYALVVVQVTLQDKPTNSSHKFPKWYQPFMLCVHDNSLKYILLVVVMGEKRILNQLHYCLLCLLRHDKSKCTKKRT